MGVALGIVSILTAIYGGLTIVFGGHTTALAGALIGIVGIFSSRADRSRAGMILSGIGVVLSVAVIIVFIRALPITL